MGLAASRAIPTPEESAFLEKTEEENKELWIYPESARYENAELGITIMFPEAWADEVILIETNRAVRVYFRKALEQDPHLGSMAILFVFQGVDKAEEFTIKDLEDNPAVSFFSESEDTVYFVTNRCRAIEMYYSDVWENNAALLEEIEAAIVNEIHELVGFLD